MYKSKLPGWYKKNKHRINFPEYLPAIREFFVNEGKIYIRTLKHKKNKSEFFIYSILEKKMGRFFIKLRMGNIIDPYPYTIYRGNLIQILKNNKKWKLHVSKIID